MVRATFSVRRALPNEATRLTSLAQEAKAHWGYPDGWLAAWQDDLTLTPSYITAQQVLVAESDAEAGVLGVVVLHDNGDHWSLEHVWVVPRAHGLGIGRALVEQALAIARERRREWVVRVESDPHAAGFYKRLGATEVGSRAAPMDGAPARALPVFEFPAGS